MTSWVCLLSSDKSSLVLCCRSEQCTEVMSALVTISEYSYVFTTQQCISLPRIRIIFNFSKQKIKISNTLRLDLRTRKRKQEPLGSKINSHFSPFEMRSKRKAVIDKNSSFLEQSSLERKSKQPMLLTTPNRAISC